MSDLIVGELAGGDARVRDWRPLRHRSAQRARVDAGRARRDRVPIAAQADVSLDGRGDPLTILTAQDATRLAELVPIRHHRMSPSPFTLYRGAAAVMAADLARSARTDIGVQLCGDAHLSNFGLFYGPDRRLVLDVNDFDETLPGPFEWDVKRLAASIVIAGRDNDYDQHAIDRATRASVEGYCAGTAAAMRLGPLATVYERAEVEPRLAALTGKRKKRAQRVAAKSRRKTSLRALDKLTDVIDGRRQIVADPPRVIPLGLRGDALGETLDFFDRYLDSLPYHRRVLLDRYSVVDVAHKIVGVGSVGTRCLIVLLESGDGEPLFLQFKEAGPSVLEAHLGPSRFDNGGERVVQGQRLTQTMGDILLGWSRFEHTRDGAARDFYFRQLWDGKGSFDIDDMGPKTFRRYARSCGAVLALAHARTGDAAMVGGYVLDDPHAALAERSEEHSAASAFVDVVTAFATRYADVVTDDHRRYREAIDDGSIETAPG